MVDIPADYADQVKELRAQLDLTQAQLADRIGVSFATVNRWENRQTKPNRVAWGRFLEVEQEVQERTKRDASTRPEQRAMIDFAGNAERARLLVEAERLSFGHLANPTFATETSKIDALPHQRIAVYDRMLHMNPLRFLLADDAGAGKTIMTGLYIREMFARRLFRRVLIVPPAGLVGNWRRELDDLFGLRFEIVRGADTRKANPFSGSAGDRVIVSVDTLAAAGSRRRLQETGTDPYDLVVFDESHKLSAHRDPDGTFRATNRYRLAEAIAGVRPLPDGWALPWRAQHLLLLTATPHMGKEFPYFCLWRLLEPDGLSTPEAFAEMPPETKRRHFIRRTKEEMVKLDGSPLYPRRVSDTLSYELTQGEVSEQTLYDRTTRYIRNNYNTARILNRSAARFAMTVFQRRLASSTWALIRSFERRLAKLEGLISDIRTGEITEEELVLGQVQLAKRIEDPFESLTADEEEPIDGLELNEVAEGQALSGVVATSLAELEVERVEVEELLELARRVDERGDDSKFERLRGILSAPASDDDGKLIVFTEHRDSLEFLVRRLEGLGFAGHIALIHGGMDFEERDRQVDQFKRPVHQGGARFLVATDAAGEGINLQFCWRMVNYDVPWNPARLEQRMGRIHRYGQEHDPVVIINLVAGATREGRVLKTLLDKLEKIREELGNDKVFDVIGRIFEGVSIRDYMHQALVTDDAEGAAAAAASDLTGDRVERLAAQARQVYGDEGDISPELPRLRDEIERETYRRLLPGFVQRFCSMAGKELGFRLEGSGDGQFRVAPERRGSLDFLLPAIESREPGGSADLTFEPRSDSGAILVHPGEPVFERLRLHVRQQFGADGARGAVLIDPTVSEPYLLHVYLLNVIRRATDQNHELGQDQRLESRLLAIRQTADGEIKPCEPEFLLVTQSLDHLPASALPIVAAARKLVDSGTAWLGDHMVAATVESWRQRLAKHAEIRAGFLKRGFDLRSADLAVRRSEVAAAARAGKPAAHKMLDAIRAEQRLLSERRASVFAANELEPGLVDAEPPRFIAHFVVVPAPDDDSRARFDRDVEAVAVQVAAAHEEALGARVLDVSTATAARAAGLEDWPGFDLLSTRASGEKLAIEVKGRAATGAVELTQNEWARACNLRDGYWLYVVFGCASSHPQLLRVRDPFGSLVASPSGSMVIDQSRIVAAAEKGPS